MFLKPRYFFISGGLGLLLSVILFSYYRTPSLPVDAVEQRRAAQKLSPQEQILQYYKEYPERYIRVFKETWQYDPNSNRSFHSFSLRNSATVYYHAIEVSFSYQAGGKSVYTQTVKVPGVLAPGGTMDVKKIEVRRVPASSQSVLITVSKALIYQ
ncbi:MAG TPA: hypothetical protein VE398_18780 [Acidobacteriota bacterium]|nr:hypothetical protein [Acidobacteriota bacterium]